jgi:hypothetical protein
MAACFWTKFRKNPHKMHALASPFNLCGEYVRHHTRSPLSELIRYCAAILAAVSYLQFVYQS